MWNVGLEITVRGMCPREWDWETNEESTEKLTEGAVICEMNTKWMNSEEVVN